MLVLHMQHIGILNPKIKHQWIQKELDWFHNQELSIQEALESYKARL